MLWLNFRLRVTLPPLKVVRSTSVSMTASQSAPNGSESPSKIFWRPSSCSTTSTITYQLRSMISYVRPNLLAKQRTARCKGSSVCSITIEYQYVAPLSKITPLPHRKDPMSTEHHQMQQLRIYYES